MRGDSLRDLYAKTLAILGLGLIAGAGAIVDYWPVGTVIPEVAERRDRQPQLPALVQNLDQQITVPAIRTAQFVPRAFTPKNLKWPAFAAKTTTVAKQPATPVPVVAAAAAVPLAAAVPDSNAPVQSWAPEVLQASNLDVASLADPFSPGRVPPSGLIGGAITKTKDSLVKAGSVTSASIGYAVKGVFGAFKKVTPF